MIIAVPALPLLAAILGFVFTRLPARAAAWLGAASLLASAGIAISMLGRGARFSLPWFTMPDVEEFHLTNGDASGLDVPLAFFAGPSQLPFVITAALIATGVVLYAIRERQGDGRGRQFFATLTLFAGAMLLFLTADTMLVTYFAWELMGVCSYLLIAHPGSAEAKRAARQAFWTTRATDFALLFGLLILMFKVKKVVLSGITPADWYQKSIELGVSSESLTVWLGAAAILILIAVIGKAALLPLSFWLPDAMVAPSPVSALLHAATMVAAGPYLLIRVHQLFFVSDGAYAIGYEPAIALATLIGAATLLFGAIMALCAKEPKKILAFSTVSHLGLVVLSVGALTESAGYLHLISHAWFKASLFLAVGYIVAISGTSALESLSGKAEGPLVKTTLVLGGLSLAGLVPFAGHFGKEHIISRLFALPGTTLPVEQKTLGEMFPLASASWKIAAIMAIVSAGFTAAYITRLVGALIRQPAQDPASSIEGTVASQAEPETVKNPVLAGWGLGLGVTLVFALVGSIGMAAAVSWIHALAADPLAQWKWESPIDFTPMLGISTLLVIIGAAGAWFGSVTYREIPRADNGDTVLQWLKGFFSNGMYLGEFWRAAIGQAGLVLAVIFEIADKGIVDGLATSTGRFGRALSKVARWVDDYIVDGVRWLICESCWACKRLHAKTMQTGRIQHYMFIVVLATAVLCLVIMRPLGEKLKPIVQTLLDEGIL